MGLWCLDHILFSKRFILCVSLFLHFLQLVGDEHASLLLWVCAGSGAPNWTRFGEVKNSSRRHFWKHLTVCGLGQRKDTTGHRMGKTYWVMYNSLTFTSCCSVGSSYSASSCCCIKYDGIKCVFTVADVLPLRVFAKVNTNTPDSVFQVLAYLRELLIFIHQNYILPALASASDLLQRAWTNLQDSCKSVLWGLNRWSCSNQVIRSLHLLYELVQSRVILYY